MKITFLGTSHGVPSRDRFCSCVMLELGPQATLLIFTDGFLIMAGTAVKFSGNFDSCWWKLLLRHFSRVRLCATP